jgi:hypothetical protein
MKLSTGIEETGMPSQEAVTASVGDVRSADAESEPQADQRLLIDGRLVGTDRVFASINPATGEVIGHAPDAGLDEAEMAIAAARRAFDTTNWSTDVVPAPGVA